jgi:transcription antitermination protein NusB
MTSRRQIRQLAMQVLFAFDANQNDSHEIARQVAKDSQIEDTLQNEAVSWAGKAWKNREQSDAWVTRLSPQWPTNRQPAVDRALLRLCVWELTHLDTPAKVVIDEAIELSREFSTEHSPAFLNGVLDAVVKEVMQLKGT